MADFSAYSEILELFCKFIKKIFIGLLTRHDGLLKIVRAFDFSGLGMSKERGHVRKGDLTRAAILDVALDVASRDGLEGVTIGILADRLDMS